MNLLQEFIKLKTEFVSRSLNNKMSKTRSATVKVASATKIATVKVASATKIATAKVVSATKVASAKVAATSVLMSLNDINFDNLNLGKSGRSVKLIYDKQSLQMSTNTLYMPFNLNKYKKQWSNHEDYTVDCYIDNSQLNGDYIQRLTDLNESIFELIKSQRNLFNVPEDEDITCAPFYRDNKTFPKLLKLQLPRDTNGNFTTQFFDENSEKIYVDENNIDEILTKKSTFKTIIECSKVYLYQGKAGCIWNILQLKLSPKQQEILISDASDTSSDEGSYTSNGSNASNGKSVYTQMAMID